MNKVEFAKKYVEERKVLSREYEVDMGVATDMLIAHVRNRNIPKGEIYSEEYYYNFTGCEKLNYEELDKELAEMDGKAVEARKQKGMDM